jgi:hypothetical protein
VLEWISQLMKPATRETALLELSKKREQVPELALILWHSFGEFSLILDCQSSADMPRCHGFFAPGNHLGLPPPQPFPADCCGFQSCLQCPRTSPVCRIPHRHPWSLLEWYGQLSASTSMVLANC